MMPAFSSPDSSRGLPSCGLRMAILVLTRLILEREHSPDTIILSCSPTHTKSHTKSRFIMNALSAPL